MLGLRTHGDVTLVVADTAVAAGCHVSTIRKHMTGRPGAVTRRG